MKTDPIIDELRAVRDKHAARCSYDVDELFRDIRAREKASEHNYVSRPPRRAPSAPLGEYPPSRDPLFPATAHRPHERKRPTESKDAGATFGYYMVGVFDVLGQSGTLRDQTGVPLSDDQPEQQRIVTNLKETAGVVIMFRTLFKSFFREAAQPTNRADSLPEPQRAEMLAAMASEVLCWGVSDSIFVAVPLARTRHPVARVEDVFASLLAAGSMWLMGLSRNHPIRGGMEIGTGIDIEPGEIYGQALEAAYRLESRVAGLPRIVVGPQCVEFLEAAKRGEGSSDNSSRMAGSVADSCLSMLCKDADGHTIVDGLGQTMLERSRAVPEIRREVSRAYDNVCTHCRDFRNAGNAKLASRYEALRAYFIDRVPNWDIEKAEPDGSRPPVSAEPDQQASGKVRTDVEPTSPERSGIGVSSPPESDLERGVR